MDYFSFIGLMVLFQCAFLAGVVLVPLSRGVGIGGDHDATHGDSHGPSNPPSRRRSSVSRPPQVMERRATLEADEFPIVGVGGISSKSRRRGKVAEGAAANIRFRSSSTMGPSGTDISNPTHPQTSTTRLMSFMPRVSVRNRKRRTVRYETILEYRLGGSTPQPPTPPREPKPPPSLKPRPRPRPQPRVVGGTEVFPENRYEYMVAFLDTNGAYYCGGVLIAPNVVLTAAHCLEKTIGSMEIGRHNLTGDPLPTSESFGAIETVSHPNFRMQTFNHDFGLVKLDGSSSFEPVRINDDPLIPSFEGQNLTVIGWGYPFASATAASDVLREATVQYIPNDICIDESSYGEGRVTNAMMCAAGNGTDACAGDSGGPLLLPGSGGGGEDATLPMRDVVVGIVSFGIGCANPDFPGVYSRISYQIDWIRETVCTELSPSNCHYVYNCFDDVLFVSNGGRVRDCDWVGRRFFTRCPKYGKGHCPVTCDVCPFNYSMSASQGCP